MTREEAIDILQEKHDECKAFYDLAAHPEDTYPSTTKYLYSLDMAIAALRPISREQVERMRGEWQVCFEDWRKQIAGDQCSKCGFQHYGTSINHYHFCPACGAPMTDEAVQMVMERINKMEETGNELG